MGSNLLPGGDVNPATTAPGLSPLTIEQGCILHLDFMNLQIVSSVVEVAML